MKLLKKQGEVVAVTGRLPSAMMCVMSHGLSIRSGRAPPTKHCPVGPASGGMAQHIPLLQGNCLPQSCTELAATQPLPLIMLSSLVQATAPMMPPP